MKKNNREELKGVIMDYVNSSLITEPLFVSFGKYEEIVALKIIKEVFGDSNFYNISSAHDNPRVDIPYCIYDTYSGDANSHAILIHCVEIAKNIHRPVFCFISHNHESVVKGYGSIYHYSEE